jgi:hypothetical protein
MKRREFFGHAKAGIQRIECVPLLNESFSTGTGMVRRKAMTHPTRFAHASADRTLLADQCPRPYSPNETSPDISAALALPVNS